MLDRLIALVAFVGFNLLIFWALSTDVYWLQLIGQALLLIEALVVMFLIVLANEQRKRQ